MKNGREQSSPRTVWAHLAECERSDTQGFHHAWVGIEPTFSNKKAVEKWAQMAAKEGGEDAYFESSFMCEMVHEVAEALRKRYRSRAKQGDPACMFADCALEFDRDPWDVERANLRFRDKKKGDDFEVRFGMDPETFEFSIKPVPLAWFNDPNFVRFLELFVWGVPQKFGLATSMAHGGGQFSVSAKTYLVGSLLADDIATKLNHPELATWMFDYPNADDRSFRATTARFRAFERILEQYWTGAFHPRAIGVLRVSNAFLDRGFGPASHPPAGLMDPARGPVGDAVEVFQNNFAFGRKVRWRAQNVDPGYWQSSHPAEDGYRPDQIMRYSEGNLNRLQIAGEWHVKSGKLLDAKDIREFDAPLEVGMLYDEASWEHRGQMSRTSAQDMVEAILLDTNHAKYLLDHPGVKVKSSLYQDQILGDAEQTLSKRAPELLAKLRAEARDENLAASRGRIRSEWVEPETLFWAAWFSLSSGEKGELAKEAIGGFIEFVEKGASKDERNLGGDPLEPHRHRVHPLLWDALKHGGGEVPKAVAREARLFDEDRETYLARRPVWSVTGAEGPWEAFSR